MFKPGFDSDRVALTSATAETERNESKRKRKKKKEKRKKCKNLCDESQLGFQSVMSLNVKLS